MATWKIYKEVFTIRGYSQDAGNLGTQDPCDFFLTNGNYFQKQAMSIGRAARSVPRGVSFEDDCVCKGLFKQESNTLFALQRESDTTRSVDFLGKRNRTQ